MMELALSITGLLAIQSISAGVLIPTKMQEPSYKEPPVQCEAKEKQPIAPFSLSTGGKYGCELVGEFLYWKPSEGGTEYALPTNIGAPYPGTTSPRSIPFEWEAGFRLGAGYRLPYDGWRTAFFATHLFSEVNDHLADILFPSQAMQRSIQGGDNFIYATDAKARWELNYWNFDFRIGREQSFRKSFLWLPYCGLRGALIHQHFHTRYEGLNTGLLTLGNAEVATRNDCNGLGLQAGVHAEWSLGQGFRFVGDFASALLYGWFDIQQDQVGVDGTTVMQFTDHPHRFSPTIDFLVALSWGTFLQHDQMHLEIHAGYQAQYWWKQNLMPRFIDTQSPYYVTTAEDLSFQGLTLGSSWEF